MPAATIRDVLRVAERGVAVRNDRPWRVRALAGAPLARLRHALAGASFAAPSEGAPACLVLTTEQALDRTGWLDYGMFLERIVAAARARGLDACCAGTLAPAHKTIAESLALGPAEIVVRVLAVGRPDPAASVPPPEPAPLEELARFQGFD
ncbi:MAG: nitroreductase family protein [Burkholderiales bacterium]|nr:nitroreductase family protein [Burkholderiales bacterium]